MLIEVNSILIKFLILFKLNVDNKQRKKESKFPVGPAVLGLFLFIVIGSAIFELFGKK